MNVINRSSLKCRKQSGLSLIELLIAMFIGLFLLVGITTSYLSSKKTSIVRDQYSILEDNGRLALEVLTRTISHTGYSSSSATPIIGGKFITAGVTSSACRDGSQSVLDPAIILRSRDYNLGGDRIGIVYLGDNNLFTDCSGGILPSACRLSVGASPDPARIYNSFFVDEITNELQCAGSRGSTPEPIAEGVEFLQIRYGIDVDGDASHDAERYVNANNVGALWDNVVSVEIALLMRALIETKDVAEAETFSLLDFTYNVPVADRYQRAVFSTTIRLRNP